MQLHQNYCTNAHRLRYENTSGKLITSSPLLFSDQNLPPPPLIADVYLVFDRQNRSLPQLVASSVFSTGFRNNILMAIIDRFFYSTSILLPSTLDFTTPFVFVSLFWLPIKRLHFDSSEVTPPFIISTALINCHIAKTLSNRWLEPAPSTRLPTKSLLQHSSLASLRYGRGSFFILYFLSIWFCCLSPNLYLNKNPSLFLKFHHRC